MAALRLPSPTDVMLAQSLFPAATLESLQHGRSIYVAHCAGCHTLYQPEKYPVEHWQKMIPEMAIRAHLSARDTELCLEYLATMSVAGRAQ